MGALKNLTIAGPGPMGKDQYGNPDANPNPNAFHPNAAGGGQWNHAPGPQFQPQVYANPLPSRPPAKEKEKKDKDKEKDKGLGKLKSLFKGSKKGGGSAAEDPVAAARRGFGAEPVQQGGRPVYGDCQQEPQPQPSPYFQGGSQPEARRSWEQQDRRNASYNQPEGSGSGSSHGSRGSSRGPSFDQGSGGYGAEQPFRHPQYLAGGGSGHAHGLGGYGGTRSGEPGRLRPHGLQPQSYVEESCSQGSYEEPPEELLCPISMLVMAEPVIVPSGVTYEKRCFEAWYNSGQRYCLRTKIVLETPSFFPNIGVAKQIAAWCQRNQRKRLPDPPSPELASTYVQRILGGQTQSGSDTHVVEAPLQQDYVAAIRPGSVHGRHSDPHLNAEPLRPDYASPIRPGSVHGRHSDPSLVGTPMPQEYGAPIRPGSVHGRHSDPHLNEAPLPQEYGAPIRPGSVHGRHSDPYLNNALVRHDYAARSRPVDVYGTQSDPDLGEGPVLPDDGAHLRPGEVYGGHSNPDLGEAPVHHDYAAPIPLVGHSRSSSSSSEEDSGNIAGERGYAFRPPSEQVDPHVRDSPSFGDGFTHRGASRGTYGSAQSMPENSAAHLAAEPEGLHPAASHSSWSSEHGGDAYDEPAPETPYSGADTGEAYYEPESHAYYAGDQYATAAVGVGSAYLPEGETLTGPEDNAGPVREDPYRGADDGVAYHYSGDHYSTPAYGVGSAYLPHKETLTGPEVSAGLVPQDDGFKVSLTHQVPVLTGRGHSGSNESDSTFRPPSLIPQHFSGEPDRESDSSGEIHSGPGHGSVQDGRPAPLFGPPRPWDSGTASDGFQPPPPSGPSTEMAPGSRPSLPSVRAQYGLPPSEGPPSGSAAYGGCHPFTGPHSGSSSSGSSGPPSESFPVGLPKKDASEPTVRRYNSWMPSHEGLETGGGALPIPFSTIPSSYSGRQSPHNENPQEPFPDVVQKLYARHPKEQEEGAAEIRRLTRESDKNRIALCSGELADKVLGGLMELLSSRHPAVQVNAVAAIMNLSLEKENKLKIARAGVIPNLIELLQRGTGEAQEIAAGAMFSLALNVENKMAIGVLGGIPHLVHILKAGRAGARRDAAMALYHLCFVQMNRTKLVKAPGGGGVNILLQIAQENESDLVSRALLILSHLALIPEGRAALSEMSNIQILVALLKGPIDGGSGDGAKEGWAEVREHAAAALFQLSNNNMRFKSQVMQAGAEEHLAVLAATGTPRARDKASSLLRIMRDQEGGRESAYPVRGRGRFHRDETREENSALF